MKSIILFSTLLVSANAFSADFLIKIIRGSGFSPVPRSSEVAIMENGKITSVVTIRDAKTRTAVATLSASSVASLKDKIELIPDNAKLVDLDINKPRCMDAPSTRVTINKGGKDIVISAWAGCHRFEVDGSKELTNIIESMNSLAK